MAREAFLELGPHTSTTVIAERVGVSQATLFKRFGSKDALLVQALLPREGWPMLALLSAGPGDGPMRGQLTDLLLAMAAFFDQMAPCLTALRSSGAFPPRFEGEGPSPPILARLRLTEWLVAFQARGELKATADTEHLAVALIAICQGRALRRHVAQDTLLKDDDAAYVLAVLDMLIDGVSP